MGVAPSKLPLSHLVSEQLLANMILNSQGIRSESEELHPLHLHCIARTPTALVTQAWCPIWAHDLREKVIAKAGVIKLSMTELQAPRTRLFYSGKKFDFIACIFQPGPSRASRLATRTGRELYEGMRVWLRS